MKKTQGLSPNQERIMSILEYKRIELIKRHELIDLIKKYEVSKNPEFLIKSLLRKKRLISIKNGVYLIVPLRAVDKKVGIDEYQTNKYLLGDIPYYIGLYNAFNKYHFTTQIPNMLFVFNTKYSGYKKILSIRIKYIKIKKDKLFGVTDEKYPYSDKERTIIDVLNYPKYLGRLKRLIDEINDSKYDKKKLIDYSIRYDSVKIMKIVGYMTKSPEIYRVLKKEGKLKYYTTIRKTKMDIIDKKWKIRFI